jgi:hypothetical protein
MSPNKFVDAFIVGKKPLLVAKMSKAEREESAAQLKDYYSFVQKRGKEVLDPKQHGDIPNELYRVKAAIASLTLSPREQYKEAVNSYLTSRTR